MGWKGKTMEEKHIDGYLLTCDGAKIDPSQVVALLNQTYWGLNRELPQMKRIISNSLNCGLLTADGRLAGYMRAVTDYETTFYLADVVIDPGLRGRGLGKAMVSYLLSHEGLQGLRGLLRTRDAFGFYEPFGFRREDERVMVREPGV